MVHNEFTLYSIWGVSFGVGIKENAISVIILHLRVRIPKLVAHEWVTLLEAMYGYVTMYSTYVHHCCWLSH